LRRTRRSRIRHIKAIKRQISSTWIYPPPADRKAAFAVANLGVVTIG
jgi:hypothetical protein